MNCLWCMEDRNNNLGWSDFFVLNKQNGLCETCLSGLQQLSGKRCSLCSRMTELEQCSDCEWWRNQFKSDPLEYNYSVFQYNSFIQEIIAKWKYRGDYVLGEIFRPYVYDAFIEKFMTQKKNLIAIPIPLSGERITERGFNQAEMLAGFLPIKQELLLQRVDGEKQSKKSRIARISTKNPFSLEKKVKNPVLLVDDIYTTGTTLRHAARLLIESGCPEVYALTLIRG